MALILIADDDEVVIEIVRETLGACGHIVGAVDDGLPVLSVVEFKRPALVILDCTMPELSGIEALRKIRLSSTCFATPVLILTARRARVDEEIAWRAGANDYLRKPFDPDQLVSRVEALLEAAEEQRKRATPPPAFRPAEPVAHRWGRR
jgi:DNA-binding response OmpR family regulator